MTNIATVQGIDIFHGDTSLDFHALAAAGVQFAYIKATQGISMIDPAYASNRARAQSVGMLTAAYSFFLPGLDPVKQADFLLAHAPVVSGDIVHFLDVETAGAGIAESAVEAAHRLKAVTGRYPWIYSGDSFYQSYLKDVFPVGDFNLAIARYSATPPITPCAIWQSSESMRLTGNPPLDYDTFYGTLDDLKGHCY